MTDRRLLWLLDERVMGRVGSLRFSAVTAVERRLAWPRRRAAVLRLRAVDGRRVAFGDLDPAAAGRTAAVAASGSAEPTTMPLPLAVAVASCAASSEP